MYLDAVPVQFVALTDGVLKGEEHVLLFVETAAPSVPPKLGGTSGGVYGLALALPDAAALAAALCRLLPEIRQIQNRIQEQN